MSKVLILFAHPRLETSRANRLLLGQIPDDPHITCRDLYEIYPDFNIDLEEEKRLLLEHDVIVWHHPFFWYSAPPLLKQWIDIVLEFGWAYGPGGRALEGKVVFNAITTGGARDAYRHEGHNRFTIREFLAPFEQTARLCRMTYLPPFAVQGTHRLSEEQLVAAAAQYHLLLHKLAAGDYRLEELQKLEYLNDACVLPALKPAKS
jgi:glutathione-regulated potassium-efflux system ancillary protein KefG